MDVVYEDEVGPLSRWVASSERMIVIALAGRQANTFLIVSLIHGCVVENNKRVERK